MANAMPATERDPSAEEVLELCRLLVGLDRDRLIAAVERLEDRKKFAEQVGSVLGDAARIGASRDDRLGEALAPLVSKGVRETVQRDPETFGKALAPAMGPAIRQSVRQMFQGLMEAFERTLEQSLSVRGWKWRFEAWRTGKPLAEIVFLHTLQYRAEHVLLIHRETGLLLQHVANEHVQSRDADLVSAMLTAIQDFVRDAFDAPEGDTLGEFQVGDLRVWVEQGQRAVLAVVLRGHTPRTVRTEIRRSLEDVELGCAAQLADFGGQVEPFEQARPALERCLVEQQREDAGAATKRQWPVRAIVWAALTAVVVLVGYSWYSGAADEGRWQRFLASLREQPGIAVTHAERDGGDWIVRGLKDPLAADPVVLAADIGGDGVRLVQSWEAYASSAPEFVLSRTRSALDPPKSVTLRLTDGVLVAAGSAEHRFVERLVDYARFVPAIARVDSSALRDLDAQAFDALVLRIETIAIPVDPSGHAGDVVLPSELRDAIADLVVRAEILGCDFSVRCRAHPAPGVAIDEERARGFADAARSALEGALGTRRWTFDGLETPVETRSGAALELALEIVERD